jgi:Heterokaryon incompatibility protein (HET)
MPTSLVFKSLLKAVLPRRIPERQCRTKLGDDFDVSLYGKDQGKSTTIEAVRIIDKDPGSQTPELVPKQLSRYVYETLEGPDKIRILKLRDTKERIECTLQQRSVSEGGYQALSYVWGNPEQQFKAFILDATGRELGFLPLTKNLQSALGDLRDADEVTSQIFWIDQICIDQEGEEKNHQVILMGDIYRNAARVITYLGPAAQDEDEKRSGIALLHRLNGRFISNYDLIHQAGDLQRAKLMKAELPVTTLPEDLRVEAFDRAKYVTQGWRWVLQAAYGEWTQRLWIVQEQLLNEEIVMLRGSSLLPWDAVAMIPVLAHLRLIPYIYVDRFRRENPLNLVDGLLQIETSMYALWNARKRQQTQKGFGAALTLLDNMARYEYQHCWDPRDRVLSLLAISCDATMLGITPDYYVSERRVFHDASVRMLLSYRTLSLLTWACRWGCSKAWSEDQPEDSDTTIITSGPRSWELKPPSPFFPVNTAGFTPHPRFSARRWPPRFRLNNAVLVLEGRFVDRVSMTTPVMFRSESLFASNIDLSWIQRASHRWTCFFRILEYLGTTVQNVAHLARAIATTPTWLSPMQGGLSLEENAAFDFWSFFRYDAKFLRSQGSIEGYDVILMLNQWNVQAQELAAQLRKSAQLSKVIDLKSFYTQSRLSLEEHKSAEMLIQRSLSHGRSFCVTENGRICNVMNQAKAGDRVAAFEGADRLFIVRPAGERYRLIGEAYVDGLMTGEAYEGLDSDEADYEIELV